MAVPRSAIDWRKVYEATSKDNRPTPGYLFNDIVHDVSYADPSELPAVANYLADCVDGDHAHVKLKALFVIKHLAFRVPPFVRHMQDRLASVQEAGNLTGPPSEMYGDEPYRLVREAAESCNEALTNGHHYHEQYREMSQRIVGFGNYSPGDDTVLPDGSIDFRRELKLADVVGGTVGLLRTGVGALVGGVKSVVTGFISNDADGIDGLALDSLGDQDDLGSYPDDDGVGTSIVAVDELPTIDNIDHSVAAGTYVPPTLPIGQAGLSLENGDAFERLWEADQEVAPAKADLIAIGELCAAEEVVDLDHVWRPHEHSILQELGMQDGDSLDGCGISSERAQVEEMIEHIAGTTSTPLGTLDGPAPCQEAALTSEESILKLLGTDHRIVMEENS